MTTRTEQVQHSGTQLFNALGVQVQFLIEPRQGSGERGIYRGMLQPGVVIPVHSHPEPELFYLLEGSLDFYQGSGDSRGWSKRKAGDALAIGGGVKHALRNVEDEPATVLLVTGEQLYSFFREIVTPIVDPPAPPTPDEMRRLFEAAAKHSYWMGSPEENAKIGISLG